MNYFQPAQNSILESSILETHHLLKDFASKSTFFDELSIAFGYRFNRDIASDLQEKWLNGTFELPNIQILSGFTLGEANGGYSSINNTVYLSYDYLKENIDTPVAIAGVILEEIGHFIDDKLNLEETPGDEGAIFSALVQGRDLSPNILDNLRVEDDTTLITLKGEGQIVEQSSQQTFRASLLSKTLEDKFSKLETALSSELNGKAGIFSTRLPILGNSLESTDNPDAIISQIRSNLASIFSSDIQLSADQIAQKLSEIPFISVTKTEEHSGFVEYTLDVNGVVELADVELAKDLGLLSDLKVDIDSVASVNLTYDIKGLKFGIDQSETYIKDEETDLDLNVSVELPNTSLSGNLGAIPISLKPVVANNLDFSFVVNLDSFNHSVDFTGLENVSLFSFDFNLPESDFNLPNISGVFNLDFHKLEQINVFDLENYNIPFSLGDLTLDLESLHSKFLEPNLRKINSVFDPIRPFLEIFKTEIPIISDLDAKFTANGIEFKLNTILDLAKLDAAINDRSFNIEYFDYILEFEDKINEITKYSGILELGEINFHELDKIEIQPKKIDTPKLNLPSGFDFHLSENPLDIIQSLVLNEPTTLFTYETPELSFDFSPSLPTIPVIGPLGAKFSGNFAGDIKFGFGFDTIGLTSGNGNYSFSDGFYVTDTDNLDGSGEDISEVNLTAGFGVDVGVDLVLANAFTGVDINGDIGINLNDPSPGDGIIRFNEIQFDNPSNIFDPIELEKIYAQFEAYFNIGFPTLSFSKKIDLTPKIPLYNENIREESNKIISEIKNFVEVQKNGINKLGKDISDAGKELIEYGADRVTAITKDTKKIINKVDNELVNFDKKFIQPFLNNPIIHFIISPFGDLIDVNKYIENNGIKKSVEKIEKAISGKSEKRQEEIPTRTTFTGEVGDSELILYWNEALSSEYLEAANIDLFITTEESELIVKGKEFTKNELIAKTFNSVLKFPWFEWEEDKDQQEFQDILHSNSWTSSNSSFNRIRIDGTNSDDRISATEAVVESIIIDAKGGNDQIQGGQGDDTLNGSFGDDFLIGQMGNDELHGDDNNDTLIGGYGNDTLRGGNNNDTLSGEHGDDDLNGEGGGDFIQGGHGNDYLHGGIDGHDFLDGGDNNDTLVGADGDDTLLGGNNNDTLLGDHGNDSLDGGSGGDSLEGGRGNDYLHGGIDGHDFLDGGDNNDTLAGADGNDTLLGGNNNDTLFGGIGDDSLDGGSGGDFILGDFGDDYLSGGDNGHDILDGGYGEDTLEGGDDNDTLFGGNNDDFLDGQNGDDSIIGGHGHDYLTGGRFGDDWLDGGKDNDTLHGNSGNDVLLGGDNNDTLDGGRDNDTLDGGGGGDSISGGHGHDYLTGGINGNDILDGGEGNDTLHGNSGEDLLLGGDNNDTLDGGRDNDTLDGGGGGDSISGGHGHDYLTGGRFGDDILDGGEGNDTLHGNSGEDLLLGGDNNDTLYGGRDNDTLDGGGGGDSISGGHGHDYLTGGRFGDDILDGGEGNDTLHGNSGEDLLLGGDNNDTLYGGRDNDTIDGQGGGDSISGGHGHDYLTGGYFGNDILDGGEGNDTLIGASGSDLLLEGTNLGIPNETNSSSMRVSERDTLTGGLGSDTFILGTSTTSYYLDESEDQHSFAEILDFELSDRIILFGSADNYRLIVSANNTYLAWNESGANDTIAKINNSVDLTLTSSQFSYI